jgi:hypothetical protein
MRAGGRLLLETAAVLDEQESYMVFNGTPPGSGRIYDDITTWWAPSLLCLTEMLRASLFIVEGDTLCVLPQSDRMGRVSLVAVAAAPEDVPPNLIQELRRTYRNPGMRLDNLYR